MLGQKNKTHIVVGKDLALLAEGSTRASLVAGTIGIFANGSATAIDGTTDLAAGDKFKVVYNHKRKFDGSVVFEGILGDISKQGLAVVTENESQDLEQFKIGDILHAGVYFKEDSITFYDVEIRHIGVGMFGCLVLRRSAVVKI